jgi:Uncharacterized ABC-type transport system, permease components
MHHAISTRVLLDAVAAGRPSDTLRLDEILDDFRARSFGVLLLLATLPCFIPLPIGVGAVSGVLVFLLGLQLLLLLPHPWVPNFIGRRSMQREKLQHFRDRIDRWLGRLERLSRPRWGALFSRAGNVFTGLLLILIGVLLSLPVPFTNYLFGFLLLLFCFGLIERDGIIMLISWVLGVTASVATVLLSREVFQVLHGLLGKV